MYMDVAARFIEDPVEHSSAFAGALIGLGIGIAIGLAIVFAPVVFGAVALGAVVGSIFGVLAATGTVIGAGVLASQLGEKAGKTQTSATAGDIADGAHTVFTGPTQAKQARMSDPLKCHPGQAIEQGSKCVFVENWNAARKGDMCDCGGKIKDGCQSVLIGGDPSDRPGHTHNEIPWQFRWLMTGLDWASTILGFLDGKSEVKEGVVIATKIFKKGPDLVLQGMGLGSKIAGAAGYDKTATALSLGSSAGKGYVSFGKIATSKTTVEAVTNAAKTLQTGVGATNKIASTFSGPGSAPATH